LLQKKIANAMTTIGNTAPNSSINQALLPDFRVKGLNIACT